jgi:hypothetical protein
MNWFALKICVSRLNSLLRYPGDYVEIEKEEYEQNVEIAKKCFKWVEEKIKHKLNNLQ